MERELKTTLPIGTKIDLFEKDGFETEECTVMGYEDNCILLKWKNCCTEGVFKLPIKSFNMEIRLTTRANSLERYKL